MARQWTWIIASLAVITVILLLLFPVSFGPYNATHGPTTDMRDSVSLELLLAIAAALCSLITNKLPAADARAGSPAMWATRLLSEDPLTSTTFDLAIRC